MRRGSDRADDAVRDLANANRARMTLRPPGPHRSERRESALDYEIAQEQATALGRLGRALEAALAALSRYDRAQSDRGESPAADGASMDPFRLQLVQAASDALWCFVNVRLVVFATSG